MTTFEGKRLILKRELLVIGNLEQVFPLLCPEREREWIDAFLQNRIAGGWNGFAFIEIPACR